MAMEVGTRDHYRWLRLPTCCRPYRAVKRLQQLSHDVVKLEYKIAMRTGVGFPRKSLPGRRASEPPERSGKEKGFPDSGLRDPSRKLGSSSETPCRLPANRSHPICSQADCLVNKDASEGLPSHDREDQMADWG